MKADFPWLQNNLIGTFLQLMTIRVEPMEKYFVLNLTAVMTKIELVIDWEGVVA